MNHKFRSVNPSVNSTFITLKNKFTLIVFLIFVILLSNSANNFAVSQDYKNQLTPEASQKIMSGLLLEEIGQKQQLLKKARINGQIPKVPVVVYFPGLPEESEKQQLSALGVECYYETWTPAMPNHPYGYIIASLPVNKLNETLALPFIKKMDTAEKKCRAMNNNATRSVRANLVWKSGVQGSAIKIGILDSGIDISYEGTDLPDNFEYKDYSSFPNIDNTVANTTTGHGTHVAATALGRGVLSEGIDPNYNGEGAFKGSAPEADLLFLKVGNDTNALASNAAIIAAIDAAVNLYNVDVLSMSYGGWDTYHDGSSALEQKVDWAYNHGVPFFISAGNDAIDDRHWSGTIAPNSKSDFIELIISRADTIDISLIFNLVWFDGFNRNDLTLEYYDENKTLINDITLLPTTESPRGTESKYSYTNFTLPGNTATYYLKVVNNSSNSQLCHIYEAWSDEDDGDYNVWFRYSDQNYTIGSPATADNGFAVGAYVTREVTRDYSGLSWVYNGYETDSLAHFSSRGPRVDETMKPDICAPGHVVISLRDKDVYKNPDFFWVDNDGVTNEGEANYYRMSGTSMACPVVAGCAALYLEQRPGATPQEIYNAMKTFADTKGIANVPNANWGAGRLNMAKIFHLVELRAPEDSLINISITPTLWWNEESIADTYTIQVSETEDFANPIENITQVDTNFVEIENLKYRTNYYWRVKIEGGEGINAWSEVWSFTTGGIPTTAGHALYFDGTDDYLIVPHSAAIDEIEANDVITLEAWVKIDDDWCMGRFPLIENFKPDIGWGWGFQFHETIGVELIMIWSYTSLNGIPPNNEWLHVAISYDKAAGIVKYYLNGELISQDNFDGDIPDTSFDDWLQIAINVSGLTEYSHGIIDELRIWKIIRTQQEIQENIYKMFDGTEEGLAALFNFNTGRGFEIVDASGNHQNGNFVNEPTWVISTLPQPCDAPVVESISQPDCNVETGSVELSGLPDNGDWTITRTPDGEVVAGSGSVTTLAGLTPGTYTFAVTDDTGCTSKGSEEVVILPQPQIPNAPVVGTITQPTCEVGSGSIALSGLLEEGNWTITISPGNEMVSGTGKNTVIEGLAAGTYSFTVTYDEGCSSEASSNATINQVPENPEAPIIVLITQPTCETATGSIELGGLPGSGNWTITQNPEGNTYSGTGTTKMITSLSSDTYTFCVTNADGCTSGVSANAIINPQPETPEAPIIVQITQPDCDTETGNIELGRLPLSGIWTVTQYSGGFNFSGTGESTTIFDLTEGTYNFTVTNEDGCTSTASANAIVNQQSQTLNPPVIVEITQPDCDMETGNIELGGLPETGEWILTRNPGEFQYSGAGESIVIEGLEPGTYNFTVSDEEGCASAFSNDAVINPQPESPDPPAVVNITHPTCESEYGSVELSGLPESETWSLTQFPGGRTIAGSGETYTFTRLSAGTYTFVVTNKSGCTSENSTDVVINPQPDLPDAPTIDKIIQPSCDTGKGSIELSGLPGNGGWILRQTPGGVTISGNGESATINGLAEGSYQFTVANEAGCTSELSAVAVINPQPETPTVPTIDSIIQPTCLLGTGTVYLSGLPSDGEWLIMPGSILDTGLTAIASNLNPGNYNFTVTNEWGCTSEGTDDVTIHTNPETPPAPNIDTIVQPTCEVETGRIFLNQLPENGEWTLTRFPENEQITGSGTHFTLFSVQPGTYTFTVTTKEGCSSSLSEVVVVNPQPVTPEIPAITSVTQPDCSTETGIIDFNGLPDTGTWTLNILPDNSTISGTGESTTLTVLNEGSYSFSVTNQDGCSSGYTTDTLIKSQPEIPSAPVLGEITHPDCDTETGSIKLQGLPSSGNWLLIRIPGNIMTSGSGESTLISGLTSGTYQFSITNEVSCTSLLSSEITINPQPETPPTPVITLTDKVLHSSASDGNQWFSTEGMVNGAVYQEFEVTENGEYYVIVTLGMCSSEPSNTIEVQVTGIPIISGDKEISFYPNPVGNKLIMECKNNDQKILYEVINSKGQIIGTGSMIEKEILDTQYLIPGTYWIRFSGSVPYHTKTFIKK